MNRQTPKGTCLQCGKTAREVRKNNYYCATVTGYEYIETLDEWPEHHWNDWTTKELKKFGIHPRFWKSNRRTDYYDLEFLILESQCLKNGHDYLSSEQIANDGMHDVYAEGICNWCLGKVNHENLRHDGSKKHPPEEES